ncbi:unnamed protein product, partial [Chrysoparadoxa australica]
MGVSHSQEWVGEKYALAGASGPDPDPSMGAKDAGAQGDANRLEDMINKHEDRGRGVRQVLQRKRNRRRTGGEKVGCAGTTEPGECTMGYHSGKPCPGSGDDSEPPSPIRWKRGELLGKGAFGRVYTALSESDGALLAVKCIKLRHGGEGKGSNCVPKEVLLRLQAELDVMSRLDHPNIVRYRGTECSERELNIFMDYIPGGSLAGFVKRFGPLKESLVGMYMGRVLLGLCYLHENHIVHRDIKGANILVDIQGECKLADFGASAILGEGEEDAGVTAKGSGDKPGGELTSIRGTPFWMAPEVVRQEGSGPLSDVWSVGCTVVELVSGKPPFSEFTSSISALFNIAMAQAPPAPPSQLSPVGQDFVIKCMQPAPQDRPTVSQLLEHEFVTSHSMSRHSHLSDHSNSRPLSRAKSFTYGTQNCSQTSYLGRITRTCRGRKSAPRRERRKSMSWGGQQGQGLGLGQGFGWSRLSRIVWAFKKESEGACHSQGMPLQSPSASCATYTRRPSTTSIYERVPKIGVGGQPGDDEHDHEDADQSFGSNSHGH